MLLSCVMGVSGGGSRARAIIFGATHLKSRTLTPRPQELGLGALLQAAPLAELPQGGARSCRRGLALAAEVRALEQTLGSSHAAAGAAGAGGPGTCGNASDSLLPAVEQLPGGLARR